MKRIVTLVLFSSICFFGCTDSDDGENGCPCTTNEQCNSGYCANNTVCTERNHTGLIINGEACTSNSQCASNNCYESKVCRAPSWKTPSNKTPNGQACTSNDQCESNNCYEGKICRAPNWKDPSTSGKIQNGKACTSNDQCESNNCFEGKICRAQGWNGSSQPSATTSKVVEEYCDKVMNKCGLNHLIYNDYDGCATVQNMHRDIYPKCAAEYDKAMLCASSLSCSMLQHGTQFLDSLVDASLYVLGCDVFAQKFIECRKANYNK